MKRVCILLILSFSLLSFSPAGEDPSKALVEHNASLFAAVFKTVNENFVDSLDPSRLARVAIDAMMHSLDPYSVYFDEAETREREKTWRGQLYAGIGAGVAPRDSQVVITEPYEGYGAFLNGLRVGDIIHAVNGKGVKGLTFDEVLKQLRGDPETVVEVTVDRPKVGLVTRSITRKQIFSKSILYHHMTDDSTGYINVSQFLKESDTQFSDIVRSLKNKGAKSLILDLRDNIGGLVQEAVNCLACFFPKGTRVCSLKGAHPSGNYDYYTSVDPIDTLIPITILTNNVTVSSGEIFAGAMQDLDRAVIIGQRTFGKGFVQGTRYPGFNTSVYLTAARYYTPSGRCIQELNYSSKYKDNKVAKMPDSLRHEYRTRSGRIVYNIGGIEPDIKTTYNQKNELVRSVLNSPFFIDYVTAYRNTNDKEIDPSRYRVSQELRRDFMNKLTQPSVLKTLHLSAENELEALIKKLTDDGLIDKMEGPITSMKKKLNAQKSDIIRKQEDEIIAGLEKEIVRQYKNRSGVFSYSLVNDPDIQLARKLLKDRKEYRDLLTTH